MVDPARSRLSRWMQRLLHPGDAPGPAPTPGGPGVPLLALEPGQEGQVLALDEAWSARWEHLSQFGLTPGMTIRLMQKRPVPIVQVGGTELALDLPVAQAIYITREAPEVPIGCP
jgi:Fe2+ transport system protein FeoA